jgi:hypothetical protein
MGGALHPRCYGRLSRCGLLPTWILHSKSRFPKRPSQRGCHVSCKPRRCRLRRCGPSGAKLPLGVLPFPSARMPVLCNLRRHCERCTPPPIRWHSPSGKASCNRIHTMPTHSWPKLSRRSPIRLLSFAAPPPLRMLEPLAACCNEVGSRLFSCGVRPAAVLSALGSP